MADPKGCLSVELVFVRCDFRFRIQCASQAVKMQTKVAEMLRAKNAGKTGDSFLTTDGPGAAQPQPKIHKEPRILFWKTPGFLVSS
jgi:hypothetical protein